MKNSEKFKTAQERVEAFEKFCAKPCVECRLYKLDLANHNMGCAFAWLDLEAEEEKPLPCPFCGKTCTAISPTTPIGIMSKVSCNYCSYTSMSYNTTSEAIAAHNRVAKKCREVKA